MKYSTKFIFPVIIMIAVFFSGCLVTSIHPLGNEDDIVFDENLIGTWTDNDDDFWIFSKGEDNAYNMIVYSDDSKGEFIAKLVKLKDKYFLDMCPLRLDTGNAVHDILLLPTHTFLKFTLDDSGLGLEFNDPEWFTERIDRDENIGIGYLTSEDEVLILTASTEELQAFYLKHADDDEFFDLEDERLKKSDIIFPVPESVMEKNKKE